jgi:protein TonB
MFEQTLLTQPPSGQKTRALMTSFMAQMSLIGVLLVAPLFYTQVLPLVISPPILIVDPGTPAPLPARTTPPAASSSASHALASPKAFPRSSPTRVPTGPVLGDLTTDVSLNSLNIGPGIPDGGGNLVGTPGPNLPGAPSGFKGPVAGVASTPVVAIPPAADPKPLVVTSAIQSSKLIKQVVPFYPSPARISRISGTVRLLARIGRDGKVSEIRTLEGHPLLRRAAEDAVRQWVYSPTILNGVAVEVEAPIDVHFSLR